jgi:metallo-beta-lactamase family protein
MNLEFFGAAGEVTGSCHILTINGHRVLLDCGLIQGSPKDEARNRDPFPFDVKEIDAVVLSHAHIDHSGRLPLLVKRGYSGPIYAHRATCDLVKVLLRDSAYLAERDVQRENRRRQRRGLELLHPLYSATDADEACGLLQGLRYATRQEILPGVELTFLDAGHIMGSCIVQLDLTHKTIQRRLIFSGDLGQYDTPILRDPASVDGADIVLMESTYGGRRHRDREDTIQELGDIIQQAHADGGNVLIPAFAVGRSQEILYHLGTHFDAWQLDRWRIYLDSPMAIAASKIYWDYPHLYDDEATQLRRNVNEMPPIKNLVLSATADDSQRINEMSRGAIVLAGSGMCTGGRIIHHLKHNLWRKQAHVIIPGYQARGSLGRRLVERRETVRIHGDSIRVAAQIHTVGGLSAHGDEQDLSRWYGEIGNRPPVFLVHGEVKAAQKMKHRLEADHGTRVTVSHPGLIVNLAKP